MPNTHVLNRLAGVQNALMGLYQSGQTMSANSKGTEREAFIESFLTEVLPPVYRFGTGDATDSIGNRSGQLDVVIEYPIAPSLPSVATSKPTRLYLAEAIAAVIEVKSDVANQWSQVQSTSAQLSPLKRRFGATMSMGRPPSPSIPLFAAGYKGWNQTSTIKQHLSSNPTIAGVLVIEHGLFVSQVEHGSIEATGPWALWGLICCLHSVTNSLQAASTDPLSYAR